MRLPFTLGPRIRHCLGNVAVALTTLILAGVGGELLAREFFPQWAPRTGALTSFWQHDPVLGWSHIPLSQGTFDSFGFQSVVRINSMGFRDIERTYSRNLSKYRIVVLGDSMVWGWGVQQNDIFTSLIEEAFTNVEVINLGVSGYGTDQELILLRQEALRYNPDLILVVVMDNDLATNASTSVFLGYQKPMFTLRGDGKLTLVNSPVPERSVWLNLASWPMRNSYLLNQAARSFEGLIRNADYLTPHIANPIRAAAFPKSSEQLITAALLLEIHDVAQSSGAATLFVLANHFGKDGVEMKKYFSTFDVPVIDLSSFFPIEEVTRLHFADRVHWTPLGHKRVANALIKFLRTSALEELQHENNLPALLRLKHLQPRHDEQ